MQTKKIILILIVLIIGTFQSHAQYQKSDTTHHKFFVGSTLFMLMNLSPKNRPDFGQLNFGYRITGKDVVSLEVKTWKYYWSLGTQYTSSKEPFPGYIREFGFALVYQRFWWKGLYSSVHVMNAWQTFVNDNGKKFDKGFQIFNTYRVGYHIKLFKDRFFIEPSLAITHRVFHTTMPDSFKKLDDKRSKFFFGEPGLHFGFNF